MKLFYTTYLPTVTPEVELANEIDFGKDTRPHETQIAVAVVGEDLPDLNEAMYERIESDLPYMLMQSSNTLKNAVVCGEGDGSAVSIEL